ncbi:uncharacterized protein RCC_02262 [Ramularia collo-cygni]|uniref:Uncharacterized protein n=1 Tax=Ramularia collo-cygni TaxID=112498 RepID=A0A2D3V4K4_9PEZI|nr:uncharacterized protein RCC_02262 [Ramularia collo-cygni]CZT16419.1 uncharacterized protein RCC_02262 [Ramularia collo-cygni]
MSESLPKALRDLAKPALWIPASVGNAVEEVGYVARANDLTEKEFMMLEKTMRLPARLVQSYPTFSNPLVPFPVEEQACAGAVHLERDLRAIGERIAKLRIQYTTEKHHMPPLPVVHTYWKTCRSIRDCSTCMYHRIEDRQGTIDQLLQAMGDAATGVFRHMPDCKERDAVGDFGRINTSGTDPLPRLASQRSEFQKVTWLVEVLEDWVKNLEKKLRRTWKRNDDLEAERVEAEETGRREGIAADNEAHTRRNDMARAKRGAEAKIAYTSQSSEDSHGEDEPLAFKRR